ncbi:MAG: 3'(2'),5'-bisphosphate nucleotidase CysQ [Alphaproteobacteria bacterium]|nr:3'(2'),5'-bisphosphate nucleotidase CysQ [Alphaproteobacteria bacterium]
MLKKRSIPGGTGGNTGAHSASPLLLALADIAYDAGSIILRHYAEEIVAHSKPDHSPVTAADSEAEEFILARLHQLVPGVPVIAEESVAAGRVPDTDGRFFLVDPLDGTKEFISRNGEFTVNIAEIVDGRPLRGVVHAPAKERMFFGEALSGAFQIEAKPGGAPDYAEARSMQVRKAPRDGVTAVASRSHSSPETDELLKTYRVREFISAGSSLKFCLVAAGEADLYPRLGTTMEWDIAAGHAILAAAGGSLTALDGSPLSYGKTWSGFQNPHFIARGG